MGHLGTIKDFGKVTKEWLPVNAQIGHLVRKWARRDDILASVGTTQGRGVAAALFDPATLQIEINTTAAFGETKPEHIQDLNIRKNQFEFPKASGAIFHEACHAQYTTWDLKAAAKALTARENDAMHSLEESRIEGLGVRNNPENRSFLRSCAIELVISDLQSETIQQNGTRQATRLLALLMARVDAGVLKKSDVKKFRPTIEGMIPADAMKRFRAIWQEFQAVQYPDRQLERMYKLAREWAALEDELSKEEDKQDQEAREAMQKMMEDLIGELGDQAEETEIEAQSDVFDQKMQERAEEKRQEAEAKAKEQQENKNASKRVFNAPSSDKTPNSHRSGGQLEYKDTRSRLYQERQPTNLERQAAIKIGRDLEKAKYHDRIKIESDSVLPPGRLRSRSVMQGAAYKQKHMHIQVEPFRRVQRKHEVDPNLTVGVMTDISGSMGGAMEPMGVTGWVMNEAVRRIQGRIAMVNYGHSVTPVLAPGQHMKNVRIYSAPDGSEAFSLGFRALDGALNLLNGTGARLLVIVSDGNYKSSENAESEKWLKRCHEEGVAVLWLGYGNPYGAERHIEATGGHAELIIPANTPVETAKQIGSAAIKALTAAGKRDQ